MGKEYLRSPYSTWVNMYPILGRFWIASLLSFLVLVLHDTANVCLPCFCIAPSTSPSNIRSHSSSSTSVLVEWDEVPQEHRNGNIQGYRVLYKDSSGPEETKTVDTSTRQTSLADLKKATVYTIKLLAFTNVGNGPASSAISVTTSGKCNIFVHR